MDTRTMVYMLALNIAAVAFLYQRLAVMGIAPSAPELLETVKGYVGLSQVVKLHPAPYAQCGFLNTSAYVVRSTRVVTPNSIKGASVLIEKGKITAIHPLNWDAGSKLVLDYGEKVVFPGVVDVHAHLNEPGKEEWEGISTGTAAAAAGGVTTLVDMPLNSFPCTCSVAELKRKMKLAKEKSHVNMGFWGGLVPQNAFWTDELNGMLVEGALGFKAFLCPSLIDDFPNVSRSHIESALPLLKYKGVPLFVHAEVVREAVEVEGDPRQFSTYVASRPPAYEQEALAMLVDTLMNSTPNQWNPGFKLHIAHLGDGASLALLKVAKKKLPISVETCPHYLQFAAEDIEDGNTLLKCAPPIRDRANQQLLIQGVQEGVIDMLSSDHSPAPASLKEMESGNFLKAWGGISGLQYLLPASWTALQSHSVDLLDLARLLAEQPAALAGLATKGKIEVGMDADLVVWDPEASADTAPSSYLHLHKISPYLGQELKGRVAATFVLGNLVWSESEGLTGTPCGKVVKRPYTLSLRG